VDDQLGGAGSEDCLHLNVYTPKSGLASGSAQKLPVLVYIHGGGFLNGNPLSWPFEHWVEQFPNTIIVSIYYRLSIFGFLSTPSKLANGGLDFNAGFQDQLLALKWVKQVLWPTLHIGTL
jgi:carboxylesterase type B